MEISSLRFNTKPYVLNKKYMIFVIKLKLFGSLVVKLKRMLP